MKLKMLSALLALMVIMNISGCSGHEVNEGEEGVLVSKPWFFGHGGVDPVPVKTGQIWTALSTEMRIVNIKPFNIDEKFDDLVTKDNNPVDFTIHMTFKHKENGIDGGTPKLMQDFGNGWYRNKVREPLRNSVRSFTKNHLMFKMTTDKTISDKLENVCKEEIEKYLKESGIPTDLVLVTVGRVMPPPAVVASTIETAVQKQQVKTQNERVKREKARALAETQSALADKAYMSEMKMTNDQYLSMKKLENERRAIELAGEGKVKLNMIMGGNPQAMYKVGN